MTHLWIQNMAYYNLEFTTLQHVHFIRGESQLLASFIFHKNLQAKSLLLQVNTRMTLVLGVFEF